jgi:plasmid stability protein
MVVAMKTTLNLDDQLLRAAKQRAAAEGTTLTWVVEEALRAALTARGVKERDEVRWIVVDGGPPRVDVADRDALYEAMERSD